MCGIVGYVGNKSVKEVILSGLQKLEYRGYDSAGIAFLDGGKVKLIRSLGKLCELTKLIYQEKNDGTIGIGHTRWATHGRPSVVNAHPHKSGNITIVHNGIVENYLELKEILDEKKNEVISETDTEIVAHLIQKYSDSGLTTRDAIWKAIDKVKGSFAIVVLDDRTPDTLYAFKKGSPLIVSSGKDFGFIASDIQAILSYTKDYYILEDDDYVEVKKGNIKFFDGNFRPIEKEKYVANWDAQEAEKGGYRHFMLKEIFEQPVALMNTIKDRLSPDLQTTCLPELDAIKNKLKNCDRLYFVACGTAFHAALIGKYMIEETLGIPVEVDIASEFRYRNIIFSKNPVALFISQSGETLDTLSALKRTKSYKVPCVSICNVRESSIARESDAVFYTHAGPEIGVASTKAFICQIAGIFLFLLELAKERKLLENKKIQNYIAELIKLPNLMTELLDQHEFIHDIARECRRFKDVMFIGRHINYPIALEAALKLKEISYLHAEGYPGGELKHGPIAIIDDKVLLVAIIQDDELADKTISNMLEVKARDAVILSLSNGNLDAYKQDINYIVTIPKCDTILSPFLFIIPLQLYAYYTAEMMGLDIDKPRNLAKSVTVE